MVDARVRPPARARGVCIPATKPGENRPVGFAAKFIVLRSNKAWHMYEIFNEGDALPSRALPRCGRVPGSSISMRTRRIADESKPTRELWATGPEPSTRNGGTTRQNFRIRRSFVELCNQLKRGRARIARRRCNEGPRSALPLWSLLTFRVAALLLGTRRQDAELDPPSHHSDSYDNNDDLHDARHPLGLSGDLLPGAAGPKAEGAQDGVPHQRATRV